MARSPEELEQLGRAFAKLPPGAIPFDLLADSPAQRLHLMIGYLRFWLENGNGLVRAIRSTAASSGLLYADPVQDAITAMESENADTAKLLFQWQCLAVLDQAAQHFDPLP